MKKNHSIYFFNNSISADTNFEDLVSKVINNHPSVAMSKETIKSSQEGINSAMWQYFPTPSVELSKAQTVIKQ